MFILSLNEVNHVFFQWQRDELCKNGDTNEGCPFFYCHTTKRKWALHLVILFCKFHVRKPKGHKSDLHKTCGFSCTKREQDHPIQYSNLEFWNRTVKTAPLTTLCFIMIQSISYNGRVVSSSWGAVFAPWDSTKMSSQNNLWGVGVYAAFPNGRLAPSTVITSIEADMGKQTSYVTTDTLPVIQSRYISWNQNNNPCICHVNKSRSTRGMIGGCSARKDNT